MTVAADRIPVKVALMDNKKLGMIRQWQEIIYGGNYHSAHLPGPDWAKLAEAYGLPCFRATTPEEVDGAIRAAQADDGPALVWFEIAETQNVFPMMPAGKGLSDLIETWGERRRASSDGSHERPRLAAPVQPRRPKRYVPGSGERHRHVLVVIVNNRPGVLNRVASLVRARNFNIESLAVGHTERPDISRMTITLRGDDFAVEQMAKQLYRLIDVLKVQDLPDERRRGARAGAHQGPRHQVASGPRCCASSSCTRAASSTSALIPSSSSTAAPSRRSTRSSRCWAASASGRWSAPAPSPWAAAPAPSTSKASCEPAPCRPCPRRSPHHRRQHRARGGTPDARTHVLRQRRRPVGARRPDRRRHRLRQPGPRPRPEPPRQRASTSSSAWRPAARAGRIVRGGRPAGRRTWRTPSRPADVVMIAVPDTVQKSVYDAEIAPNLRAGQLLMFAHGFNIRFGRIVPPAERRRRHGRAQGPGPPAPLGLRGGRRRAGALRGRAGPLGHGPGARPGLCARPRLARARASSRRPSPRRPRPTSSASRRSSAAASRPHQGGLRDARRGRLPARAGLLRDDARAQAHRRPDVPRRPQLHALQRQRHRRVRRLRQRPARHGGRQADHEGRPHRHPERPLRGAVDRRDTTPAAAEFQRLRQADRDHQIEQVGAQLRSQMAWLDPVEVTAGQAQASASRRQRLPRADRRSGLR